MDNEALRKRLGMNIRAHREAHHYSQRDFANMIHSNQSYLWEIEVGRVSVGFDMLCKIAEALDIKVNDLIDF